MLFEETTRKPTSPILQNIQYAGLALDWAAGLKVEACASGVEAQPAYATSQSTTQNARRLTSSSFSRLPNKPEWTSFPGTRCNNDCDWICLWLVCSAELHRSQGRPYLALGLSCHRNVGHSAADSQRVTVLGTNLSEARMYL